MLKCIVWDLDDTLWHGTLAEGDRPALNEKAVQAIRAAEKRGLLQSVASRNNPAAALAQLEAFGLSGVFLHPMIDPYIIKASAAADLAEHFNININSLALVDDNPFELYEINRYLPEVMTFAVGELDSLMVQIEGLPMPSGDRRAWMERREARLAAEKAFTGTRAEFLAECKMTLTLRNTEEKDILRVAELAGRANKINNLPGGLADAINFENYLNSPKHRLYVCELEDIFGEHGVVGAALFRSENDAWHIDLFCISCRVEGRGVAAAFLTAVLRTIGEEAPDIKTVYCRCANAREGMALSLLKSLGFTVTAQEGTAALTRLDFPGGIDGAADNITWINVRGNVHV